VERVLEMAVTTIDSLTDSFCPPDVVLEPENGIKISESALDILLDDTSILGKRKASQELEDREGAVAEIEDAT
jgi:hypothetical protein